MQSFISDPHDLHDSHDRLAARRTYLLLRTSLLDLLCREPYEKISLTELCAAAMIPRSTFYRYFEDKDDLQRYCLQAMLEDAHFNEDVLCFKNADSIRDFLLTLIRILDADLPRYRDIYQINKDGMLMKIIRDYLIQILAGMLKHAKSSGCRFKIEIPIFSALLADFYFSTLRCYMELSDQYDIDTFVDNVCLFSEKDFFL
ncbi:MAG: TetR/AcrR family transcriptional regulator [Eubacteriales bacterium]|nr:TetR/AcrR family transcriptional regulator [Eubacteriales bacterium]